MALLIGIWGGPRKIYAALKFFIYTMAGSVLLLVAIIALYLQVGSFDIRAMMGHPYSANFQCWVFLAFFISFAIKVPMFPFHTWLPAAHVEAPTAGSVLLASILLKMGTYGFLRFSLPITPHATHVFMPYILGLSVVAIIYGGLTSLAQSDLKKLVAYSSVAHMGFATMGIFALNAAGIEGATLVMINHGVTTGALFIAVGIIYERLHTRDLLETAGMGKHMPIFAGCLGVFCLSSLAFPGTNSFIGEFLVLVGGFAVSKTLVACCVPGVVLAAAYMLRMIQKVAYGGVKNPDHSGLADLNFREVVTFAPLLLFVFWIGLNPEPFTRVMHASVENLLKQATCAAAHASIARKNVTMQTTPPLTPTLSPPGGEREKRESSVERRDISAAIDCDKVVWTSVQNPDGRIGLKPKLLSSRPDAPVGKPSNESPHNVAWTSVQEPAERLGLKPKLLWLQPGTPLGGDSNESSDSERIAGQQSDSLSPRQWGEGQGEGPFLLHGHD
jgi:NADH-quinone oxidoreductase subunit M